MENKLYDTPKLKLREKMAYGIGELPNTMVSVLAAFLTMFYTDNVGMAAGAVGTMFFVSKIFDGVTDLLAGYLVDQTRTKWGKARPWLLWLSVPIGLSLALIFFIPVDGSPKMKLIYAFVTYNLYNSILYTMVGCAKNALMPLMTQRAEERMSLSKYNTLFGLGGVMIACSVTFPFVNRMGGDVRAWKIVFIVYGLITVCGLLFAFTNCKEYVTSVEKVQTETAEKIKFSEGIKLFFHNKYFIFTLVVFFLVQFSTQINSASQTYFYKYSMADAGLISVMNLVSLVPMLISVLILPSILLKHFGKKHMVYLGAGIHLVTSIFLGVAASIHNVPIMIIATVLKNLSVGALSIPVGILSADAVDYGEYISNKRIEGLGVSVITVAQKVATGVAAGSVGWILQLTGYVGDGSQSAATINGINMLFCYIPAIVFVLILVLFKIFYHYDEEEKVVLEELARRKQEKK